MQQDKDNTRDVMQEPSGIYQEYRVSGTPAEIGRQMAAHDRSQNGPRLEELSAEQVEFARACGREARRIHPPLFEELGAWAEACSLPLDEALFHFSVGMTETSRRGRSRRAASQAEMAAGPDLVAPAKDPESRSCSTIGLLTPEGPLIGRNFDLSRRVNVRHFISTVPDGYLPHAGMYDGLSAGRTDGMNSRGLFVSLHTVRARPPVRRKPGLFCVHLVRAVLETCYTARQAAERLAAMPHIASFSYFLADPREMLVVEAHPERARVRGQEGAVLACTNHFVHPEMAGLLYAVPMNSAARLKFLAGGAHRLLEEAGSEGHPPGSLSPLGLGIETLIADHSIPVCGHTETMTTLWSVLAEPGRKKVAYCLGAPCRNPFSHLASWG